MYLFFRRQSSGSKGDSHLISDSQLSPLKRYVIIYVVPPYLNIGGTIDCCVLEI